MLFFIVKAKIFLILSHQKQAVKRLELFHIAKSLFPVHIKRNSRVFKNVMAASAVIYFDAFARR
jgi:hypothetical protein